MSRRAQGYATISDPRLPRVLEMDTFSCAHCNCVVHLHNSNGTRKPPDKIGGYCGNCSGATCNATACNGKCTPFEKVIDASEARGSSRRRLFAELGLEP